MTAAGGGILARGIPVAVKEAGEAACTVVIEWGYILYANYSNKRWATTWNTI